MHETSLGLCVQAHHHEMKCFVNKIAYQLSEIHYLALIKAEYCQGQYRDYQRPEPVGLEPRHFCRAIYFSFTSQILVSSHRMRVSRPYIPQIYGPLCSNITVKQNANRRNNLLSYC